MATVQVADITKLVMAAQGRVDMVVRKVTLDLYTRVILATPVDTGRARGGWTASTGQPQLMDPMRLDPTGSGAVTAMIAKIGSSQVLGARIYLTNNVEYIRYLEYGAEIGARGSPQAPLGMVRIAAAEFAAALARANSRLP